MGRGMGNGGWELRAGEAGAQVVNPVHGHDPEQTCWHQRQLFPNVVRPHLLGKFGRSLLKARGLQISRNVDQFSHRPRGLGQQGRSA